MSTSHFHPIIREWFEERFREPTEAQAQGWAAVAEGKHTLIAAPTGSGKTLAAFLTCIDRLVRQGIEGDLPDTTQVVYVSPLKALSNDIQKNLAGPLEEIVALAARRYREGQPSLDLFPEDASEFPEIRVGLRTGDTPQYERQKMAKSRRTSSSRPPNRCTYSLLPPAAGVDSRASTRSSWTRFTRWPTTSAVPISRCRWSGCAPSPRSQWCASGCRPRSGPSRRSPGCWWATTT